MKLWRVIAGQGLTRTQTLVAHVLLALALLMALPVEQPGLWILTSAGDNVISPHLWSVILAACALCILLARGCRAEQVSMTAAAILLGILCAALYLTLGLNSGSTMAAVLFMHAIGSAAHLKHQGRRPHGLS